MEDELEGGEGTGGSTPRGEKGFTGTCEEVYARGRSTRGARTIKAYQQEKRGKFLNGKWGSS